MIPALGFFCLLPHSCMVLPTISQPRNWKQSACSVAAFRPTSSCGWQPQSLCRHTEVTAGSSVRRQWRAQREEGEWVISLSTHPVPAEQSGANRSRSLCWNLELLPHARSQSGGSGTWNWAPPLTFKLCCFSQAKLRRKGADRMLAQQLCALVLSYQAHIAVENTLLSLTILTYNAGLKVLTLSPIVFQL